MEPDVTPATPGQAAYEAFLPHGPIDWEYADSDVQAMWEAAAEAVIQRAGGMLADAVTITRQRDEAWERLRQAEADLADAERADTDLVIEILRNKLAEDGDDALGPGALAIRYVRSLEERAARYKAERDAAREALAEARQIPLPLMMGATTRAGGTVVIAFRDSITQQAYHELSDRWRAQHPDIRLVVLDNAEDVYAYGPDAERDRYRQALDGLAGKVDRFLNSNGLTVAELIHALRDARKALDGQA